MPATETDHPRVVIITAAPTDVDPMAQAGGMLERFGVTYDEFTISPHRSPRHLADFVGELEPRGVEVVIAGASMGAALAGVVAANTVLPVIGCPLKGGTMDGLDALLAMSQMPAGVPVATVGLGHAINAAVLAVQMLAMADPDLRARLWKFKEDFELAAHT